MHCSNEAVNMTQHLECGCQCTTKEADCNSLQKYVPDECRSDHQHYAGSYSIKQVWVHKWWRDAQLRDAIWAQTLGRNIMPLQVPGGAGWVSDRDDGQPLVLQVSPRCAIPGIKLIHDGMSFRCEPINKTLQQDTSRIHFINDIKRK